MRQFWLALLLLTPSLLGAQGVPPYASFQRLTLTSVGPQTSINNTGVGVTLHNFSWRLTGTVTACTFYGQYSSDNQNWHAFSSPLSCLSAGTTGPFLNSNNYVRMYLLTFAGSGSVTITYTGYSRTVSAIQVSSFAGAQEGEVPFFDDAGVTQVDPALSYLDDVLLTPAVTVDGMTDFPDNFINVRSCGATGDGTTNDYAAINACITVAELAGKALYFPSATFVFGTTLALGYSNMAVECAPGAVLKYTGVGVALDFTTAASGGIYGDAISNCLADLNHTGTTGLRFKRSHHILVNNVKVRNLAATGTCFQTNWSVGGTWTNPRCSVNEGDFGSSRPLYGMVFDQDGGGEQTTTHTVNTPLMEGMSSGVGLYLKSASSNVVNSGTSEGNVTGVQVDALSSFNTLNGIDLEANSGQDIWDKGFGTKYDNVIAVSAGTVIGTTANNTTLKGGNHVLITIQAGALNTNLDGTTYTTLSDSGTATQFQAPVNSATDKVDYINQVSNYLKNEVPSQSLSGFTSVDAGFVANSAWNFTTTPLNLSTTVVTASKPWRAIFLGIWGNSVDGTGLVAPAMMLEATSASAVVTIGAQTVTFAVTGGGLFRGTASSGHVSFVGTVFFSSQNITAAGLSSFWGVNTIRGSQFLTTGNCSSAASPAVCGASSAGSVSIAAATTSVQVNTTAVTANSQIFLQDDSGLGTKLGVTCNTSGTRTYRIASRNPGNNFVIDTPVAPVTNPACLSYEVRN